MVVLIVCHLTLKMKSWGLRPLVLHVDAGWNSEIAVSNIEKIVKFCKFDLYTKLLLGRYEKFTNSI